MRHIVRSVVASSLMAALWLGNVALAAAQSPVHTVKAGETLADIAIAYDVSLSSLMLANGLTNPNFIWDGQELVVAQASTPSVTALGAVYVVQYGDTLGDIAARYGVSALLLAQANGIDAADYIEVGQQLAIPGGSSWVIPEPSTAVTHRVQYGEYLASIAELYGIPVLTLAEANGIGEPWLIYPGQVLTIPTGEPSVAEPATGATPTSEAASEGTPVPEEASDQTPTPEDALGGTPTPDPSSEETPTPETSPDNTPAPADPSGRNLHFYVNITTQYCSLYQDESLLYDWPCSTGRDGAATIPGEFKVQSKIRNAWGSRFNAWMPYWLGIYWAGTSENGIHALPIDAYSGITWWADQVGTPITFGCIMLDNEAAIKLWGLAYIGMPVTIGY